MANKIQDLKYKVALAFTGRPSENKKKKELKNLLAKRSAEIANTTSDQL